MRLILLCRHRITIVARLLYGLQTPEDLILHLGLLRKVTLMALRIRQSSLIVYLMALVLVVLPYRRKLQRLIMRQGFVVFIPRRVVLQAAGFCPQVEISLELSKIAFIPIGRPLLLAPLFLAAAGSPTPSSGALPRLVPPLRGGRPSSAAARAALTRPALSGSVVLGLLPLNPFIPFGLTKLRPRSGSLFFQDS